MTTPAPLPRRAYPFPSRRLRRASGALALALALGATGACELRLGEGSPASLPSASTTEVARDALARQATLIGSTATVVLTHPEDAKTIYITSNGKRYHTDPHCNGGTYWAAPISSAIGMGLTPCQKCIG